MDRGVLRAAILVAAVTALAARALGAATPRQRYDTRYGAEASGVRMSRDRADDAAFAAKLFRVADGLQDDLAFQVLLYEKAYWFGIKGPDGRTTAIRAARRLMELVPQDKDAWEEKILMADFLVLAEQKNSRARNATVRHMVARFVALADRRVAQGKYARAANLYREAIRGASRFDPGRKDAILAKLKAISARAEADERLETLKQRLKAEPANQAAAAALLRLYLVDRDDPKTAAQYADLGAADETEKRLLLVASMKMETLPEKALPALGDWYRGLAAGAGPARGDMLRRAKAYFERYLAVHTEDDDARTLARTKLAHVTQDLAP